MHLSHVFEVDCLFHFLPRFVSDVTSVGNVPDWNAASIDRSDSVVSFQRAAGIGSEKELYGTWNVAMQCASKKSERYADSAQPKQREAEAALTQFWKMLNPSRDCPIQSVQPQR